MYITLYGEALTAMIERHPWWKLLMINMKDLFFIL
jgi:hypothetical protein